MGVTHLQLFTIHGVSDSMKIGDVLGLGTGCDAQGRGQALLGKIWCE